MAEAQAAAEKEEARKIRARLAPVLRSELQEWYERLCTAMEVEEERAEELGAARADLERQGVVQGSSGAGGGSVSRVREYVAAVREKAVLINSWCDANEGKLASLDAEACIQPPHRLHKQLLDAVAVVSAVDDAIETMKEALENNVIELHDLVAETRKQARHQYEHREVARRIAAALEQAARGGNSASSSSSSVAGGSPAYPGGSSPPYAAPRPAASSAASGHPYGAGGGGFTMASGSAARW